MCFCKAKASGPTPLAGSSGLLALVQTTRLTGGYDCTGDRFRSHQFLYSKASVLYATTISSVSFLLTAMKDLHGVLLKIPGISLN